MNKKRVAWNKGLTKADPRVAKHGLAISKALKGCVGRVQSEETKKKLSDWMKKAQAEGRAHNIGECRWKCEPSYPEKFFMSVIQNEFEDKNVTCELYVKPFAIDFAWVEKKLAIEIDGGHHEKPVQIERDRRKDALLESLGWRVLRIPWKQMFHEPKKWIQVAKDFVGK